MIVEKLSILDLFTGIGGFSLGLERSGGFETKLFCEIDKHCIEILRIKQLGNSIIPRIAEIIGKAIVEREGHE